MREGAETMTANPNQVRSLVDEYVTKRIDRRQFLARALSLGLSAPAAGMILAACGSSSSSSSGRPASSAKPPTTTITYRPETDIQNLDPAFFVSQDDSIISDCVNEGLITYKPGSFDVVNCLAESFEPSADGLSFHFKLKKGIEWHKGYGEVRASDVKFSYERIAGLTKPKLNSPYSGDWSALETVKAEGPYEGTIILKSPFAPLLHSTLPVGSGKVLPEKAVEALGKRFATSPVGSGPFEFVSWTPHQSTVLKRFSRYSGANRAFAPKSPFDAIQTSVINSDNTAYEALQSGAVSYAYLPPSLISQAQHAGNLKVFSRATLNYYFLSISQKNVPNINLRRAIRSAIDVDGVIKAAYNGRYVRAYGIIPPAMKIGYWPGAPRYNQDLSLARSYLAKSGQSNVTLTLTTTNDGPSEAAAQVIAANLGQVGIKVNIDPQDPATFDAIPGNGGGGKGRELVYSLYVSEPDPYWSFIWFTCSQMGLWNWSDWCDPAFTKLLNEALATYDVAKRDRLYVEAAKLWDKQANIVWIAYPTWYFVAQPWVRPSIQPDGYPNLWATTAT
jgi:peptide/nickel transport system substrate-binding protein